MCKYIVCFSGLLDHPVMDHGDIAAGSLRLMPAVCHEEGLNVQPVKKPHGLMKKLIPQIFIQSRERFVKQHDLRIPGQDPRQGASGV